MILNAGGRVDQDCHEKGRARVLAAFANAFRTPDLRKKIFFTLTILAAFRLGSISRPQTSTSNR